MKGLSHPCHSMFINPQCACTVKVTKVKSVSQSVSLLHFSNERHVLVYLQALKIYPKWFTISSEGTGFWATIKC